MYCRAPPARRTLVDLAPGQLEIGGAGHRPHPGGDDVVGVHAPVVAGEHLVLLLEGRVADQQLEHEPVELRLGQRVGALVLDRVLGRDDDERVGQRPALALDGHLPLLHRLEQRRLRLRRRAVDLVGQEQVGEDRTLRGTGTTPSATSRIGLAGDIGRHQVGGELHALEVERAPRPASSPAASSPRRAPLRAARDLGPAGGDEARQRALLTDDDLADLVTKSGDCRECRWLRRRVG